MQQNNTKHQCQGHMYKSTRERGISQANATHMILTLTVLVATIDAQWEGMGDVGSARYEPALLPMPDHKGFKLQ